MSVVDDETEKNRITDEGETMNVSATTSGNENNSHRFHHAYEFLTKIEPVGIFKSTKGKSIHYHDHTNEGEHAAQCSNIGPLSAEELKAEVMNIPCLVDMHDNNYKDKMLSPTFRSSYSTITDIVQKLKEAYRACKCKTCKCIGAKYVTETNMEDSQCEKCDRQRCTDAVAAVDSYAFGSRTFIKSSHNTSKDEKVCDCILCNCIVCEENIRPVQDCSCIYCECVVCQPQPK